MHDPDILILDEPTTGLDPAQIIEIRELIKRIGKKRTIILCSHILPEVQATCDRILIISGGKRVASGTPEDLTSSAAETVNITAKVYGPGEEIKEKINALDHVIGCKVKPVSDGGPSTFVVKTKPEGDPGQKIFQMVVDNGYSLSELRVDRVSLEEVFLQLTTQEREEE